MTDFITVPREATQEMVRAAYQDQPGAINVGFAQAYRVMVAASPRPTDPVGEEAVEAAREHHRELLRHLGFNRERDDKLTYDDAMWLMMRAYESAALQAARHMGGDGGTWTLADLREANVRRQAEWCSNGEVPDLSFRGLELAGEVGEACNVAKKLERERLGWRGSRSTKDDLATELADVVICADLMAIAAGVELMSAVRDKFNATTDKVGLTTKLATGRGRSEG